MRPEQVSEFGAGNASPPTTGAALDVDLYRAFARRVPVKVAITVGTAGGTDVTAWSGLRSDKVLEGSRNKGPDGVRCAHSSGSTWGG